MNSHLTKTGFLMTVDVVPYAPQKLATDHSMAVILVQFSLQAFLFVGRADFSAIRLGIKRHRDRSSHPAHLFVKIWS